MECEICVFAVVLWANKVCVVGIFDCAECFGVRRSNFR